MMATTAVSALPAIVSLRDDGGRAVRTLAHGGVAAEPAEPHAQPGEGVAQS